MRQAINKLRLSKSEYLKIRNLSSIATEIPSKHITRSLSENITNSEDQEGRWSNENQNNISEMSCEIYLLLKLFGNCAIAN